MTVLLAVPPSALAIRSLETIPGSVSQTPALGYENFAPPVILESDAEDVELTRGTQDGGTSRRSSICLAPMPGSYFPSATSEASSLMMRSQSSQSHAHVSFVPSNSGASTPSERPKLAQISIPQATPDEPLFSAYPDSGTLGRKSSKGKGKERASLFSLSPAFTLSRPPYRRRNHDSDSTDDENPRSTEPAPHSSDESSFLATSSAEDSKPRTRRRALSASHVPPPQYPSHTSLDLSQRRNSLRSPGKLPKSITFSGFRKRRASINSSTVDVQQAVDSVTDWRSMESQVASRFESRQQLPFSYEHPADSDYTLQSVSTVTTTRPLASPPISARRSSLAAVQDAHAQTNAVLLGLSNMAHMPTSPTLISEVISTEGLLQPHGPPPRRSSLSVPPGVAFPDDLDYETHHRDGQPLLSASVTTTETTASLDAFSPSTSSNEHPLSSATTSLSRSAKSGKEDNDEKDAQLNAVRLQRSLEWEARQDKQRRRLEKRKMILLELIETEISYIEDLKILVEIYLPQLAALPGLSETTIKLVARNTSDLLFFHTQFASRMVDVLKEEAMGYETRAEPFISDKIERVSRRIAALFVEDSSGFAAYNEFCAGSIAAATVVRNISQRADFDSFERRCQIISASHISLTLKNLLAEDTAPAIASNRSRLRFKDFLIMPIQRVCRYPMLLASLLGSAASPSPAGEVSLYDGETFDVGVDVERALGAMRAVAEEADEARRLKETEIKSATVLERLELHPVLTPTFLRSLGTCRLIGALDVLHHHPVVAPLIAPVKVKYLAAFLFRGYLILAKVKKGKVYEPKHFLPLEVFELIDITEGFLPHSIRLTLREHNFDLAASCAAEKDVWAAAVCEARDESVVPPFELPASVSPFAARTRRMSTFGNLGSINDLAPSSPTHNKRHTLAGIPQDMESFYKETEQEPSSKPPSVPSTPIVSSPTRASFSTPGSERRSRPAATILLRRASTSQRINVDRGLVDVFSETCSTARSKAQMQHTLFLPDHSGIDMRQRLSLRDSTVLRRRRSFLDSRSSSVDILSTGEIKGLVMPPRQWRSSVGNRRSSSVAPSKGRSESVGGYTNESSTEVEGKTVDEDAAVSDFGTMVEGQRPTRSNSFASISSVAGSTQNSFFPPYTCRPANRLVRGHSDDRHSATMFGQTSFTSRLAASKRKTASAQNLYGVRPVTPSRAKSMPVSPIASPEVSVPPPLHTADAESPRNTKEYFENISPLANGGDTSSSDVFALGQGLTNQPHPAEYRSRASSSNITSSSPWASLRRNMSILSRSRNSVISLGDSAFDDSRQSVDSDCEGPSRPSVSSGEPSSHGPNLNSVAMSTQSLHSSDEGVAGGLEDDDSGVVYSTKPKRRRSLKMFTGLRFTPI